MPKISVIVPVYKAEKYIEKCLNSVINQTFKDIEAIFVNDGSPENEQIIIDKFKKKYPKIIKSFIKDNGGQSDARNYGLDHAKGDYIFFLDSDDYLDLTTLEKMYNKALENDFDMVAGDFELIYDDDSKNKHHSSNIEQDIFHTEEIKEAMIDIYGVTCNKLFKKNLLENRRFKKGVWYEDVELLYRLMPHLKSIGVVKEPLYKYYQRISGNIMTIFNEHVYDYIDNMNGLIEYYKENGLYDEFFPELEYVYVRYVYATFIKTAAKFDKHEYNRAVELAIQNVTKTFPNYKNNKYLKRSKKGIYLKYFNKFLARLIYIAKHK